MKQTRQNVFETNSSSSHTLTFNCKDKPIEVPRKNIKLKFDEEDYSSMSAPSRDSLREKLHYFMIYCIKDLRMMKNLKDCVHRLNQKYEIHISFPVDIATQDYDADEILDKEENYFCYINHQSSDVFDDICRDKDALYHILEDSRFSVKCYGDGEYDRWENEGHPDELEIRNIEQLKDCCEKHGIKWDIGWPGNFSLRP